MVLTARKAASDAGLETGEAAAAATGSQALVVPYISIILTSIIHLYCKNAISNSSVGFLFWEDVCHLEWLVKQCVFNMADVVQR